MNKASTSEDKNRKIAFDQWVMVAGDCWLQERTVEVADTHGRTFGDATKAGSFYFLAGATNLEFLLYTTREHYRLFFPESAKRAARFDQMSSHPLPAPYAVYGPSEFTVSDPQIRDHWDVGGPNWIKVQRREHGTWGFPIERVAVKKTPYAAPPGEGQKDWKSWRIHSNPRVALPHQSIGTPRLGDSGYHNSPNVLLLEIAGLGFANEPWEDFQARLHLKLGGVGRLDSLVVNLSNRAGLFERKFDPVAMEHVIADGRASEVGRVGRNLQQCAKHANRSVLIVNIDDIRLHHETIAYQIGWEETVSSLKRAIRSILQAPEWDDEGGKGNDPLFFAHAFKTIVVSMLPDAVASFEIDMKDIVETTLCFEPRRNEGDFQKDFPESMSGLDAVLAVSIAHAEAMRWKKRIDHPAVSSDYLDPKDLGEWLKGCDEKAARRFFLDWTRVYSDEHANFRQALVLGLKAARVAHIDGFHEIVRFEQLEAHEPVRAIVRRSMDRSFAKTAYDPWRRPTRERVPKEWVVDFLAHIREAKDIREAFRWPQDSSPETLEDFGKTLGAFERALMDRSDTLDKICRDPNCVAPDSPGKSAANWRLVFDHYRCFAFLKNDHWSEAQEDIRRYLRLPTPKKDNDSAKKENDHALRAFVLAAYGGETLETGCWLAASAACEPPEADSAKRTEIDRAHQLTLVVAPHYNLSAINQYRRLVKLWPSTWVHGYYRHLWGYGQFDPPPTAYEVLGVDGAVPCVALPAHLVASTLGIGNLSPYRWFGAPVSAEAQESLRKSHARNEDVWSRAGWIQCLHLSEERWSEYRTARALRTSVSDSGNDRKSFFTFFEMSVYHAAREAQETLKKAQDISNEARKALNEALKAFKPQKFSPSEAAPQLWLDPIEPEALKLTPLQDLAAVHIAYQYLRYGEKAFLDRDRIQTCQSELRSLLLRSTNARPDLVDFLLRPGNSHLDLKDFLSRSVRLASDPAKPDQDLTEAKAELKNFLDSNAKLKNFRTQQANNNPAGKDRDAFLDPWILPFPCLALGKNFFWDRNEIEMMRDIYAQIGSFLDNPEIRFLNIVLLGTPGSGKSSGVNAIIGSIPRKEEKPFKNLEFNLSQFRSADDLTVAFELITEAGVTNIPVVTWDEYDSVLGVQAFGWVQQFLRAMQDGKYTTPNGDRNLPRSIFFFAGSRITTKEKLLEYSNTEVGGDDEKNEAQEWAKVKGRDFKSRLAYAFVAPSVKLGPEKSLPDANGSRDKHWKTSDIYSPLLRRAKAIRYNFKRFHKKFVDEKDEIRIDFFVALSLLLADYIDDLRSIENVIKLSNAEGRSTFDASCLPTREALELHCKWDAVEGIVYSYSRSGAVEPKGDLFTQIGKIFDKRRTVPEVEPMP